MDRLPLFENFVEQTNENSSVADFDNKYGVKFVKYVDSVEANRLPNIVAINVRYAGVEYPILYDTNTGKFHDIGYTGKARKRDIDHLTELFKDTTADDLPKDDLPAITDLDVTTSKNMEKIGFERVRVKRSKQGVFIEGTYRGEGSPGDAEKLEVALKNNKVKFTSSYDRYVFKTFVLKSDSNLKRFVDDAVKENAR